MALPGPCDRTSRVVAGSSTASVASMLSLLAHRLAQFQGVHEDALLAISAVPHAMVNVSCSLQIRTMHPISMMIDPPILHMQRSGAKMRVVASANGVKCVALNLKRQA